MHRIKALHSSVNCQVTLPLSKSIINRLLVINHLSNGVDFNGLNAEADDIAVLQSLLKQINSGKGNEDSIHELNVGNAGTVMRFLTALLAITPGKWLITGSERMQQRPLKPLTDALQQLGAELSFTEKTGFPPVYITGNPYLKGGTVKVDAAISSQYISALMMIAPVLKGGLNIELQGEIISGAYIRMTQALMRKAGVKVDFNEDTIIIPEGKYQKFDFNSLTEPDWSAVAFWFEMVALSQNAEILLKGLKMDSVQGDKILTEIFENLGVNSHFAEEGLLLTKSGKEIVKEFSYDFTECPDLAQAVIVTCTALGIKGRFSGLKTLRIKETDRITALKNELSKLGYSIEVVDNDIVLNGGILTVQADPETVIIKCYDDHRMAMAFAPLALIRSEIYIDDPQVVKKSYPGFWRDLEMVGIARG
jgi:3-phosphoshikimate 1-carboxyvinyltransferase